MELNPNRGGEPKLSAVYNEEEDSIGFLCRCADEFSREIRICRPDINEKGYKAYLDVLFPFTYLDDQLKHSFLPQVVQDDISSSLNKVRETMSALVAEDKDGFPIFSFTEAAILNYLNNCYSVFYFLLLHHDNIKQWKSGQSFLKHVLCFGCDFSYDFPEDTNGRIIGVMTPLAPCYLSALLEVAKEKQKGKAWWKEQPKNLSEICREILRAYMRRYMNWCIVAPTESTETTLSERIEATPPKSIGWMYRARLRMYTENEQDKRLLSLPIIPLEKTSSYEGVSELRLFEKIKYELEYELKQKPEVPNQPFQVVLVGEIDYEMFLNLHKLLISWINNRDPSEDNIEWKSKESLQVNFVIATKNSFPEEDPSQPSKYQLADYDAIFSDSIEFSSLIEKSNLLLFLDCCELYEPVRLLPYADLNSFLQQAVGGKYETHVKRDEVSETALASGNMFMRMFSLLTGAAYGDGTPAFLEKITRRQILDLLERELEQSPRKGVAYVYYSDLNAARELYWKEDHFLRVEQYACKQIAILRFGGREEKRLNVAENRKDRVLVFNLWQFIKHTAMHRLPTLMEYFQFGSGDQYQNIYWLSEVQIGVDYADWSKSLRFYYWIKAREPISNPKFEEKLKEYLTEIIIPCFVGQDDNLYTQYLRKCCTAFLYSDAKNVDDMLFLHLFEKCHSNIRSCGEPPEKKDLENLICSGKKYSGKRFYQEVIADYDGPSEFFANQYRKLGIMVEDGKLDVRTVFNKVRIACEENNYKDSYLYQKCLEKLK